MKRVFFGATVVAAAAMVAACSGGGSGAGAADPSAKLIQTAAALEKKLGAPGEKAQMPAADDPDVRAFDSEADRALIELGTPAMPVAGSDSFDRLCGPATNITAAYVSAGLGGASANGLPVNDPAKTAKMNENATRYMAQMMTPLLYLGHCTAVHMPVVDKEFEGRDLSGKAAAVAQVRNGAYGQFTGLVQLAASPDIQPEQRKRVMNVLVRDTGSFAVAFSPAQRQELGATIDQAAQASPEFKAQAGRIRADIANAPCRKLCSA
jgi:hypothetical protein